VLTALKVSDTRGNLGRKTMPSAKSVDPAVRKAVEGISAAYAAHFNKQDAVALAGLFTKDGVLIAQSPEGLVNSGTSAIVQRYKSLFKSGFTKASTKVDQVAQLETMRQSPGANTNSLARRGLLASGAVPTCAMPGPGSVVF
jgi:hypothetical protein